jgi:hypothetical protein
MEHIFVTNGTVQLILSPEDDLDRLLLAELLKDGPLELDTIRQPVSILGKSVKDGIIIRKKKLDASEIKDVPGMSNSKAHMEIPRER